MRKILAKILTFVFIVNTIISSIGSSVLFAADTQAFKYNWEKTSILDDTLNITEKGLNYNNIFLWWDFGINNGMKFDAGTYNLSYNIQDNKRVDFSVEKRGDLATVVYQVWDYAKNKYVDVSDTIYQVYKNSEGMYIEPTSASYPEISPGYSVIYEGENGVPTSAKFSIIPDTGFALKFDNKNIKFKWKKGTDNDTFYFETNGVEQGNIYDFNLKLDVLGEQTISRELQIFNGINLNTLTSVPYANNRKNEIDHSTRPFPDQNPGFEPEIVFSFDMPKVWDDTLHKYVFPDTSQDQTAVIMDFGNSDDKKKIQVTVENIYANDINSTTSFSTSSDATVKTERENNRIVTTIANLKPGTIYNPVEISLYKPNNSDFLSEKSQVANGTVYTFPEFSIISRAVDQFYLKIEPFQGYKGFYVVNQGATSATLSKWAEYEDKTNGEESIYITVNLNAINKQTGFFQIDFKFTPPDATPGAQQVSLKSQILKYTPTEEDVVIGTPLNLEVVEKSIVPNTEDKSKQDFILKLRWDVSYKETLLNILKKNNDKLDVYCTFNKGDKPYDENELPFAKIKLGITKVGEDDIEIEFSDEEGKIKSSSWTTREVMVGDTKYNTIQATVEFKLPTAPKETGSELFLYPNVYFINVRSNYTDNNNEVTTAASLPVDVVLDDITSFEVPQPQNVSVINTEENKVGRTNFGIKWDNLYYDKIDTPMYRYLMKMLDPRGYGLAEESIKFNVYIVQSKTVMDNMMKYNSLSEDMPQNIRDTIKIYDNQNKTGKEPIDVSQLKSSDNVILRDWLRKNGIVKIENVIQEYNVNNQEFNFTGLDKNQEYYIVVETDVIPIDNDNNLYLADEEAVSSYSEMISATTLKDSESPEDDENNPPSPINFKGQDITLNSVELLWNKVKEIPSPDTKGILEYQFVRMTGQQMNDELLKSRLPYSETWTKLPPNSKKAGWKTGENKIYEYNENIFSSTASENNRFEYDIADNVINSLIDHTLNPNELYFYYIRTVRIVENKDVAYSVWVPLSVTTTPVEGPENLKVERDKDYDKESEVVISFDLPAIDPEKIGTEYQVQYQLKEDGKDWSEPVNMNAAKLKPNITIKEDGKVHCIYTIEDLKSGTLYSIRVRLYNTVLKDTSLYSNVVQHITDMNQDDYDDEHESNEWVDHYKELLAELGKKPYWTVKDSVGTTTLVYRPLQFGGVIAQSSDSTINLEIGVGGTRKEYYLPASAIEQAYDSGKGIKVTWRDMDVIFSPKAIDTNLNDAIMDIRQKLKTRDIDDYFVKLSITFNEVGYSVEGNNPLSPSVDIQVEAVGTDMLIVDWDNMIYEELYDRIESTKYLKDILEDLKDNIDDRYSDEEMVEYLKDEMLDFEDSFCDYIEDELDDTLEKAYTSAKLDGSIIIAYPIDATTQASGYRQDSGAWIAISLTPYNSKHAIYSTQTGTFVFAGKKINIPGISGVDNGNVITNLVVKFGLDDYLGKDAALNLNTNLTKYMAVGCTARVAGAEKTADPNEFFASKGVKVSARSPQSPAEVQEVIYLTMLAYQVRTNTNIDSIKIRNYNTTANIQGIQSNYKKSVQAAFETGIYTNKNMNPKGSMTVNEFLQMLVGLTNKVNL